MKTDYTFEDNLEEALKNEDLRTGENNIKQDFSARELDVFISYSSLNKNVADAVVSDFEKHGIRCWYAPRDIMPGQEWVTAIHEAINASKLFILIYTDSSNESKQVANEVALAFNSGKTLIPFKLSDTEMSSELEYYLTRVHWLDAVNPPLMQSIESLRIYSEKILKGDIPKEAKIKNANASVLSKRLPSWVLPVLAISLGVILVTILVIYKNGKDDYKNQSTSQINVKNEISDSSSEIKYENVTENSDNTIENKAINEELVFSYSSGENLIDINDNNEKNEDIDYELIYKKAYEYQRKADREEEDRKTDYYNAYEQYKLTNDHPTSDINIAMAMNELGTRFVSGSWVELDYDKALFLINKSIASGYARAYNSLGSMYLIGDGVNEDYLFALDCFEKAALNGDDLGMYNLGYMYENGFGDAAPDLDKAKEWYKKASEKGNALAERAYKKLNK